MFKKVIFEKNVRNENFVFLLDFCEKSTFSNYIKMRLNGIDRRYANDHQYIIFLYQIKESLEIKRSRVIYFKKCKINEIKYTKATLGTLTKTGIERSDLGFKAFKNVRGTTPYFESKKKDLFSMIRQIGPPHIFHKISPRNWYTAPN